ncbi:Uncharacterised protein [Escherichia coli]|nr:Uncharacterised protein [Escherichia coli]
MPEPASGPGLNAPLPPAPPGFPVAWIQADSHSPSGDTSWLCASHTGTARYSAQSALPYQISGSRPPAVYPAKNRAEPAFFHASGSPHAPPLTVSADTTEEQPGPPERSRTVSLHRSTALPPPRRPGTGSRLSPARQTPATRGVAQNRQSPDPV